MKAEEFVEGVKLYAGDAAVNNTLSALREPPGKRPSERARRLAELYAAAPEETRQILEDVVKDSVFKAVFGVLCILDGARAIEDGPNKGDLELYFVKNGERTLLNPPGEYLHDIYRSMIPPT